ncbi:MAG TPA: DUF2207 domain-containing protein [Allosphingosinicella sp.]|jgi:hypothetical protein
MRLPLPLLALLGALALLLPGAARADERILHFLSDVTVERDGTLEVAETIRLRAEGDEIRRGILRDFPTRYTDRLGRRVTVGFEMVRVERDGKAEPWAREGLSNGVRIRIGDADVLLDPGEHVYVIRYRTTRQLGFFDTFDELYWNATGTGWTFPIDVAEAVIRLPSPAAFGDRAVYTGPEGSTARYAEVVAERPGEIRFRTTAPLYAYEGLTVAAAWPKGVVEPPAAGTKAGWWLRDNGPLALGILGLFGVLAYYFHAWRRAGRGPQAGTVVPLFTPPDGLSPAAVRHLWRMGSDNRTFAAALIDLGVRGCLRLREEDGGFFSGRKTYIERREGADTAALPTPEAGMMSALFGGGDSLLMDDKYHATFRAARNALDHALDKAHKGKRFLTNWHWSVGGVLLMAGASAVTALVLAALDGPDIEGARGLPMLIPLLALPVVLSAFWWMKAPTREGRALMDRIEGFRRYLSITEEERLETLHPPEKTPELFERYLPYAIALDVENEWAERFATVLAAAAAAGQAGTMSWYSGRSDPWNDTGGFVDRVGSSLTSSVSSASTAPGSSSGSSGGGSSGGGGGGGGGSGW